MFPSPLSASINDVLISMELSVAPAFNTIVPILLPESIKLSRSISVLSVAVGVFVV